MLDEIYIVEEQRNRGYGRAALRALEKTLSAAGVQALHLVVSAGNRAAELYRRMGYEPHESLFMSKRFQ